VQYHRKYKKNDIFIISPSKEDPAFKDLEDIIQYIKIDDSLLDDPLDINEFHNCVIVFDDSEVLGKNKDISKAIERFRDQCLECGRKLCISTIVVNHVALNGAQTKKVLNECDLVVLFPKANFNSVSNLCKRYYGFGKEDLEFMRKEPSRYCVVKRSFPQAIVSEQAIRLV
jgi:hypothetical protein